MTVPDQYPQLPDGVAPRVAGIAGEFAAIRHGVEEAARHFPPVITFPPPPVSSPPETSTTIPASALVAPWTNFGGTFAPVAYQTLGTRVFLRGTVVTSAALTGGYAIFHLPVGVWPASIEPFISTLGGGGAIRVDVNPDGSVGIAPGTSIAANAYLSLSGITFSTLP